MSY
ncbi:hypothetical protein D046_8334A, partial [Vibrio parahaemolyticus V-223/04]|jgi:hypothetical protein